MRHQEQLKMGTITTLDEPVIETIVSNLFDEKVETKIFGVDNCPLFLQMRDLNQVKDKLKVVLLPLGSESQHNVIQKLRDCK